MSKVKLLRVRTPAGHKEGYVDIIGQTVPVTGNAYVGFEIKLPDGSRRGLQHYFVEWVEEEK